MIGDTNAQTIGGTVGSDTRPIKIVGDRAVAVGSDLALDSNVIHKSGNETKTGSLQVNGGLYLVTGASFMTSYAEGETGRTIVFSTYGTNGYRANLFLVSRENGNSALVLAKTPPGGTTSYQIIAEM